MSVRNPRGHLSSLRDHLFDSSAPSNERWIRCLAVQEPKQIFYIFCLTGISAIKKYICPKILWSHINILKTYFMLSNPFPPLFSPARSEAPARQSLPVSFLEVRPAYRFPEERRATDNPFP